ncbi:hypothetical protein ColTof4_07789 [Colletotrichum tofieldiae]|nr:hypothetical protein ColTof3_02684 [Colletotrichum tofieldiae]GKT75366.1 hypothetical protein ColTof4_07789 [Colletotrichum tofieldiae]
MTTGAVGSFEFHSVSSPKAACFPAASRSSLRLRRRSEDEPRRTGAGRRDDSGEARPWEDDIRSLARTSVVVPLLPLLPTPHRVTHPATGRGAPTNPVAVAASRAGE